LASRFRFAQPGTRSQWQDGEAVIEYTEVTLVERFTNGELAVARALGDFKSDDGTFAFGEGSLLRISKKLDDFYEGVLVARDGESTPNAGMFPSASVKVIFRLFICSYAVRMRAVPRTVRCV
jgi:hypothetical protein